MFMLNLLFDLTQADGIFSGDRPGGVLNKSKNWLRLPNFDVPGIDPAHPPVPWQDLGEGPLIIATNKPGNVPDPHMLRIRIAPVPGTAPDNNATIDGMVAFGSRDVVRTPYGSPFIGPAGETLTAFPLNAKGLTPAGWHFPIDKLARKPDDPNKVHQYEFVVAVKIVSGGVTRHYGHDPDWDIGY
jgi:hypothetical protein